MLEGEGGSPRVECQLKRHLSPAAVGRVIRALPLSGNAHRLAGAPGAIYIEAPVGAGAGRHRTRFAAGEIAFLAAGGGRICFFAEGCDAGAAMSPIGAITAGAGTILDARPGQALRFYAAGL